MLRHRHNHRVSRLQELELFRRCRPREIERLAEIMEEVSLETGAVLCDQGRPAKRCFILLDGEADVFVGDHRVAVVGAGESVGEMGLIDRLPRSATVTARTPINAYAIDGRRFDELLDAVPSLARSLLAELSGRIRTLDHDRVGLPVVA